MLQTLNAILAILLVILILLQQRGVGLGAGFGGEGNVFKTKRGVDKLLFRATILVSLLFFIVSLALLA